MGWVDDARQAQGDAHAAFLRAAAGEAPPEQPHDAPERPVPSFDAGARQSVPAPPPSHEQTLVDLIRNNTTRW